MTKRTLLLLILPFFLSCKKTEKTLFVSIPASETNISFANNLTETQSDNVLNYEYFYNGGGVAAGDFNNDGLIDLFFTGNQVGNALYLNKGEIEFEDITAKANIKNENGAWNTGVSLVDINADGLLDIYVCRSGLRENSLRKNQLFIN
ncbi:MAG: VCBS repeat-containing protein, partial [Spirosomaceae bacterium]|nr:VCBS repeat-containing protein [Spirosomataceae bacterium]